MQALTCSFSSLRLGPVRCQQVKSRSCIAQRTPALTVQKHSLRGCALRTEAPNHVQEQRSEAPVTVCKLKTRKAAAKRYKVTGTGKVLTRRPGKQHINEKKSPKRLRNLGKLKGVALGNMIKVKKCLPYAGI